MEKIGIIKLGAKGDVIRTLSILPAIKKKYPNSEISWITKSNIADLVALSPIIDNTIVIPWNKIEEFDILYNFDIEKEATDLATKIKAKKKYGFYEERGYPMAFNPQAEYYLNTIFDDQLKKENRKTYQEIMFELAGLKFEGEEILIKLSEESLNYSKKFIEKNNLSGEIIGIHMGAGPRWPSKAWSESKVRDFIRELDKIGYKIILFGGPDEIEKHKKLSQELIDEGIRIYNNNPENSNEEFASLVNLCDKMVCSDTFALHLSVALKKPTVGLFFCTSPAEVEPYSILRKVVSPMLYEFFPEKMDQFDEKLINSITCKEVLNALGE